MNKTAIFALTLMRGKISLILNHSAKLNFETLGGCTCSADCTVQVGCSAYKQRRCFKAFAARFSLHNSGCVCAFAENLRIIKIYLFFR